MSHWYIQIGADMNQEALSQVKQDLEHLIADVQNLVSDLGNASKEEALELKEAGLSSINKVLEQVNLSKDRVGKTTDYLLCKTKCTFYERPFTCLGLAALVGIAVGAMMTRK